MASKGVVPKGAGQRSGLTVSSLITVAASALATLLLLLFLHPTHDSNLTAPVAVDGKASILSVRKTVVDSPATAPNVVSSPTGSIMGALLHAAPPQSLQPKGSATIPLPATSDVIAPKESLPSPVGTSKNRSSGFPSIGDLIQCPRTVHDKYSSLSDESKSVVESERAWCANAKTIYRVIVGRSWGTLSKAGQKSWEDNHCNEHTSLGKVLPCDEKWGWSWLRSWIASRKTVAQGASQVTCFNDPVRTSTFCEMRGVAVDFSKVSQQGDARAFADGFMTIYGDIQNYGALPFLPGMRKGGTSKPTCDIHEPLNTYVLSNDDIFNLGHYINDVVMIWAQMAMDAMQNVTAKSQLLNFDGLRERGPAGGSSHRLMLSHAPDTHGPYSEAYYHSWFDQRVVKAVDYGSRTVCFDRLVTIALPGVPWFWNDWGRMNDCSLQASSPLYQSFNYFLRKRVAQNLALRAALQPPPADTVHIVIEVRKINPAKRNNHSSARFIRNLDAVVKALEQIPGVVVTAQDFAELSFVKQIQLAHRASVLLSMHGAGTTHIFHMALGEKNCCGLLELFPDESIEFMHAQGYGNLARQLGLHTVRYVPPRGSTTSQGTTLEVQKVQELARGLVEKVRQRPTCLHDVRDV